MITLVGFVIANAAVIATLNLFNQLTNNPRRGDKIPLAEIGGSMPASPYVLGPGNASVLCCDKTKEVRITQFSHKSSDLRAKFH